MRLEEFKAWLEGFNESIIETPSEKQWNVIKEKIKTIDDNSWVLYNGYLNRYKPLYPDWSWLSYGDKEGYNTHNISLCGKAESLG